MGWFGVQTSDSCQFSGFNEKCPLPVLSNQTRSSRSGLSPTGNSRFPDYAHGFTEICMRRHSNAFFIACLRISHRFGSTRNHQCHVMINQQNYYVTKLIGFLRKPELPTKEQQKTTGRVKIRCMQNMNSG